MLQWPLTRVAAALQGLASCIATSLDSGLRSQYGDHVLSHDKDQTLGEAVVSTKHSSPHGHRVDESVAAEQDVYETQLKKTLDDAMAERDPRRIQITRLKYGLEDGVEWTYPELASRFNQSTNVLKGIVRTEVNFLRSKKKDELQDFANHML